MKWKLTNGMDLRNRDTARGLIVRDDEVLLMERFRDNLHYFSIPGGQIEPGESSPEAVLRELAEETSLLVNLKKQVLRMEESVAAHDVYLCEYLGGEAQLAPDAPEQNYGPDNVFIPRWIKISDLANINFGHWEVLKFLVIDGLTNGFGNKIAVVTRP